jgi:hypothetical protein
MDIAIVIKTNNIDKCVDLFNNAQNIKCIFLIPEFEYDERIITEKFGLIQVIKLKSYKGFCGFFNSIQNELLINNRIKHFGIDKKVIIK